MSKFLQTPEFFEAKFQEAQELLGKHLLIGISHKGGVVFGRSFNPRSHKTLQWVWHIEEKPSIVLAAIGDFRDVVRIKDGLRSFIQKINDIVGGHALSAFAVAKFVSAYFGIYHDEPQCLAAEIVVTDVDTNNFFLVSFTGRIKQFTDFVVAGPDHYRTPFTEEEVKDQEHLVHAHMHEGAEEIKLSPAMLEKIAAHMIEVRKPAIAFLKKELTNKNHARRTASDMQKFLMVTLGLFDPPSESEKFEVYFASRKKVGTISVDYFVFNREVENEKVIPEPVAVCPTCKGVDSQKKNSRPRSRKKRPRSPLAKRIKKSLRKK